MRGFDEEDVREVGRIIVAALDANADLAALAAGAPRSASGGRCIERLSNLRWRERVGTWSARASLHTGTVTEVTHPLVQHKLGLLRDVTTTTQMFRQLVNELTLL